MTAQTSDPVDRPVGGRLSGDRRQLLWLLAILVGAFAIRVWALSWGLPTIWNLDEENKTDVALDALSDGGIPDLEKPQPGFLYNSLYVIFRVASMISPTLEQADHIYLGRLLMAVIGVLTVLGVWLLTRELVDDDDPRPAFLAALLVAVLPFSTAVSRYIKEDGPIGFWTVVVMLALVRYWKVPSTGRAILLGLAMGACFSTKFSAVILFPVIGIAILAVARRDRTHPGQLAARIGTVAAAAAVGVLLVSPQYIVDPEALWNGFKFQVLYSQAGHHDGIAISPWAEWWTYYARHGLIPGMTWPVFLIALAGAVPLLRRPAGWTIVAAAVLMYLVLEDSPAKPAPFAARYLTTVVPLLCVQAAFGIQMILRQFAKRGRPTLGLVAVVLVFFAWPTVKSLLIADEANHDTRTVSGNWMDEHWPAGTPIVIIDNHMYRPAAKGWDETDIWKVEDRGNSLDANGDGDPPPYFVLTSFRYQRYLDSPDADPRRTDFYRQVMTYRLVKKFEPKWLSYGFHSPTILIYQK